MAENDDVKARRANFENTRREYVDYLVSQHEGLTHHDFDGVEEDLPGHAKTIVAQRVNADREAGARALGISVEDFDALKAGQAAASAESTPEERTAALPTGTAPTLPGRQPAATAEATDDTPKWGTDLIEAAVREEIEELLR
jgi:hypothetical protein